MIAKLIDNDGYVVSIFEHKGEMRDSSIAGVITTPYSWDAVSKEPAEAHFFADITIKWDSCSHVFFYGEDSQDRDRDRDAYYHLCGLDSYIAFMRQLAFAYEILVNHVGEDYRHLDKEDLKKLRDMKLLEGYTIVYN